MCIRDSNNLGILHAKKGDMERAAEYFDKSGVTNGRTVDDDIAYLQNVGNLTVELDNKALELKKERLDLTLESYGRRHEKYANALHDIGICYANLENFADALLYLNECEKIRKELFGEFHPSYLQLWFHLAEVYYNQEKYTDSWREVGKINLGLSKAKLQRDDPFFIEVEKFQKFLPARPTSAR
eukprot:TRINITY_DN6529_c0_g1_i2.p1 TRINITY_DN6529_c0_g1~~TRINITY_DN6529_c0_g1_i2.p1  ORF type:complete len:184 (+),score=32.47 TRINITY_DN6529_c0_g1_i2:65-616(+)